MMTKHDAAWWRSRVDELEAGGDAEAIARRHAVQARTLEWWRCEFGRRARKRGDIVPKLLPVVVDERSTEPSERFNPPKRDLEVVLESRGGRLTLRGAVAGEHLEAIVRGLVAPC